MKTKIRSRINKRKSRSNKRTYKKHYGGFNWFNNQDKKKIKIVNDYCEKIGGYIVSPTRDAIHMRRCFSKKDKNELIKEFQKKFGRSSYTKKYPRGIKLKHVNIS